MDDQEVEEEETTKSLPRSVRVGEEQISLTGDDNHAPHLLKANPKGDDYDSIPDLADLELATQFHVVDRSYRRRQLCKKFAVVLGVILLLIAGSIGIAMLVSNQSQTASAASASAASTVNKTTVILPPPTQDLSALCDPSNEQGRASCKAACAPAACCSSTLENCKATNSEICDAYSACLLMNQSDGVGNQSVEASEAEQAIKTLCEDTTDEESLKQCKKLCAARACCFATSGYMCYDDFKEWCDEYKICATQPSEPVLLTLAPSPIVQSSQATSEPHVSDAPFDPSSAFVEGAQEMTEIEKICSMDAIAANGTKACTDLCRQRACCFVDESEFNCVEERRDWCEEYSLCTILNMGAAANTTTPVVEDVTGNGMENAGEIENTTTPVAEGEINGGGTVEGACSFDFLATNGKIQCERMCDQAQCCFTLDDTNCAASLEEWCLGFKPCLNLVLEAAPESVPTYSNVTNSWPDVSETEVVNGTNAPSQTIITEIQNETVPEASNVSMQETVATTSEIDTVCSAAAVAANGLGECEFACSKRACCFVEGGSNCFASAVDWCSEYIACSIINGGGGVVNSVAAPTPSPTSNNTNATTISLACAAASIATLGKDECQSICKERACCFIEGDFNCYNERMSWCDEYSACKILNEPVVTSNSPTQMPASSITESATNNTFESIYGIMEAATNNPTMVPIVFVNVSNPPTPATNSMETAATNAPTMLPQIEPNSTAIPSSVDAACLSDAIATNGPDQCHSLCIERLCCFYPGDSNCAEVKKDWCDEYRACKILPSFQQ
mmetsp:Transcript_21129/g.30191  ORF Transcript_21129/g.30191 Transcript_21129/m.30191 type:complete len:790 (+) Transcript_21129:84-2453(+)